MKVAIIGAGLSGAVLAHTLSDSATVHVFEKSRGAGGRMSTRRTDTYQFDHGAQFFTAREESFQNFLTPYIQTNLVQQWSPKILNIDENGAQSFIEWDHPHYVASPRMNMLCKTLLERTQAHYQIRIASADYKNGTWFLQDEEGNNYGSYDLVVLTAPPEQAFALLPERCDFRDIVRQIQMKGCYALMLGFEKGPDLDWDVMTVQGSPVSWGAVNSTKPEREGTFSIVVHSDNDWAEDHIDDDQDQIKQTLISEFCRQIGITQSDISYSNLHRWRYAKATNPAEKVYFWDNGLKIGVCGDWCSNGRVEGAFLSADALAKKILSS